MAEKLFGYQLELANEIARQKKLPSFKNEFEIPDSIEIAGVVCPIYNTGRHYIVELTFLKRTVVCQDGMAILELRDMFKDTMS